MHTLNRFVTPLLALLAACATTPASPEDKLPAIARDYIDAFTAAAGTQFVATIDRDALATALGKARVLWLGDSHRSSRVHALQLELLADLQRRGLSLVLVLEAFGTQDAPDVNAYLAGELPMETLQERIRKRWPDSWLDDLDLDPFFYTGLLRFGKKHNLPVMPLEPTPRAPLGERDAAIADVVQAASKAHPDRLIVVVVGQAHLLGTGNLVQRCDQPWVAIGGEPPVALRRASPDTKRFDLLQSESGLFWFGEACRQTR